MPAKKYDIILKPEIFPYEQSLQTCEQLGALSTKTHENMLNSILAPHDHGHCNSHSHNHQKFILSPSNEGE
jgi:hypothetical protein